MKHGCKSLFNILIEVISFVFCQCVYTQQFQNLFPFSIIFLSSKTNNNRNLHGTSVPGLSKFAWIQNKYMAEECWGIDIDSERYSQREAQVEALSLDSHVKKIESVTVLTFWCLIGCDRCEWHMINKASIEPQCHPISDLMCVFDGLSCG